MSISRSFWALRVLVSATLMVLFHSSAQADVSPMRVVLELSEGNRSFVITVTNPTPTDLPIEMSVVTREVLVDGTQVLEDASDTFAIFPPLAYIPPGGSQSVRATYTGSAELDESRAFILYVKEVPLPPEPGFSGVQFAHNFGVAVYLNTTTMASGPFAIVDTTGDQFIISNEGDEFALATELEVTTGQGSRRSLQDFLEPGQNPILPPNATRRFNLRQGEAIDPDIHRLIAPLGR